ncbi:MAG: hypothetical protein ACI9U5_001802 [Colwellia sp.]|jgi:hypothetical protein
MIICHIIETFSRYSYQDIKNALLNGINFPNFKVSLS